MPFLPDGTPVEMVLNPLGVPSRMNIGRVLETHLGWAARGLGQRLNRLMEENYSTKALKAELKKAYSSGSYDSTIDAMEDDDVRRAIVKVKNGIHVASPVFDGAPEEEIRKALELAEMNISGQSTLFDGRTGDAFDGDVTVGVMYMLSSITWSTTRFTLVQLVRIAWLRSNLSVVKLSLVVSVWVKWKSGRWRRTVLLMRSRSSSP